MKKKMFISIEVILTIMVIMLAFIMIWENNEKERDKISVIIQNSDDNQWDAFKYGLKMAAEDRDMEIFVASTEGTLTVEEEKNIIESEIDNGADAVIVQPIPGAESEKMLKKFQKKIPVMLMDGIESDNKNGRKLSTVGPDNYIMGKALAKEMLIDYNKNIKGKTIGIFSEKEKSGASRERERGVLDVLKNTGAEILWSVSGELEEYGEEFLEAQRKVDLVVALDDSSLTIAGKCASMNNLHGAVVYGIGNSTDAIYYLDTGFTECLIVPDDFSAGYQSVEEMSRCIGKVHYRIEDQKVSYAIIRRETLFLEKNQKILFAMSQ